ncbi:MAG: sensor histidine kinase [Pseudomonadota bacterium]
MNIKSNTIKWRIFKYNIIVIIMLIALVAVIFNLSIRFYIEREMMGQLGRIASRTEDTALKKGPDFFKDGKNVFPPPPPRDLPQNENDNALRYYFMLDRSLKESMSVLNANYILLDISKTVINPLPVEYSNTPQDLLLQITREIEGLKSMDQPNYLDFNLSGTEYIAIVKPVSDKNNFGLGWIVIYSSLQQVNQLQLAINIILLAILLVSALIIVFFSSIIAKKVSAPFSSLNQHIRDIAEIKFGTKIQVPVYDELQELVSNFNIMSEKLETYDKAQKTFLQNASHEFRTPLMSIQSYAEGIKYGVTDSTTSADIIIDESKRLTRLVENLLYLSRLDAIEESYCFNRLDFNELLRSCADRMNAIAAKNNIVLSMELPAEDIAIIADDEKISRAISNILGNCIRFAQSVVNIKAELFNDRSIVRLSISDDGPGLKPEELPYIFDRFYKGSGGNFGLGLAISKNVIEKHKGSIIAQNSNIGAVFQIDLPASQ